MSGVGAEDLEPAERDVPDFPRGSNGAPKVMLPDGSKSVTYSRTSSVGNILEDDSGLTNWRISKALEGQAKRPELVAATLAASPYEDNKKAFTQLREEAIQAGRGSFKADLGTAVHAMSERWEEDDSYDPGDAYRPALELYSQGMARLGLVSDWIECKIVNDEHKIAGTADRIYKTTKPITTPDMQVLPSGTFLIGDLKTGDKLDYSLPGYTIQLAGYAGGSLYDVEAQIRIDTPKINQDWAIIVHLSVDKMVCEFLWVNLEVGRYGLELVDQVKEWRRNWRRVQGYKADCVEVLLADEVAAPGPEPESDHGLEHWMRQRLADIKEDPEARKACIAHWPTGTKVASQCETQADWIALDDHLANIEAEFGLAFTEAMSQSVALLGLRPSSAKDR